MGATASKKWSAVLPSVFFLDFIFLGASGSSGCAAAFVSRASSQRRWMSSARASEARGPAAMTTTSASTPGRGRVFTSSRCTVMFGSASTRSVTSFENASRSTDREPPAGTRVSYAHSTHREPNRLISSFRSPAAEATRSALKEFEQMSSAKPSVLCAGVLFTGRIS